MRKFFGYTLLAMIYGFSGFMLYYNIKNSGWYFVAALGGCFAILGIAVLAVYLINDTKK